MHYITDECVFSIMCYNTDLPLPTTSPTYLPSSAGQVQGTTPSPGTAPSRPSLSPTCGTGLSWRTLMLFHHGQLAHLLPSMWSSPSCWPGYKWIIYRNHLLIWLISFQRLSSSQLSFLVVLLYHIQCLPYLLLTNAAQGGRMEDVVCRHPLTR